jgi:hypothetical protein
LIDIAYSSEVKHVHQDNIDSNNMLLAYAPNPKNFPIKPEAHVPPVKLEFPS